MKIVHICLCGPVTDNWSYQDNLLPKYHKKIGYDVSVITSQYIWNEQGKLDIDRRKIYFNEYGIKTIRLKNKYHTTVQSKFKKYRNLYQTICEEKPDILFVHGIQFLDIVSVVKYLDKNPKVTVYVDNHADFSNSATNFVSRKILHGMIWKVCGNLIEPYTNKFYGVLPARVNFLREIYRLPNEKLDLLVLGADDEKVIKGKKDGIQDKIRERHSIKPNDFLIITGGKIDAAKKQTILLIRAIKEIDRNDIKLLIFGSVSDEIKEEFNSLIDGEKIIYIGWISGDESYKYFSVANLAFFPGRHSVLWEQAVGIGLPCIFKYWEGTTHVDVGGNCLFLHEDSVSEIKNTILKVLDDKSLYENMKKSAEASGMEAFSYENIARKSIQRI